MSTSVAVSRPRSSRSRERGEGAVVGVPRGDDLVAERDQVEHGGDRGHARGVGQAAAALERAERVLEGGPGRVAVAAVLEVPAGDVRRGHGDRRVQRLVRLVRRTAGVHGGGRGSQLVGHATTLGLRGGRAVAGGRRRGRGRPGRGRRRRRGRRAGGHRRPARPGRAACSWRSSASASTVTSTCRRRRPTARSRSSAPARPSCRPSWSADPQARAPAARRVRRRAGPQRAADGRRADRLAGQDLDQGPAGRGPRPRPGRRSRRTAPSTTSSACR